MHFVVIPHTHWDREWYLPFESSRVRLVNLIDILLNIVEKDPEFRFMLDGQTVILEDYLEVKPENEERLKKHIKEGRIQVGPWFVQPDEFLISGESLIRNLLVGEEIARKFGKKMNIGYLPDTFGHIQELPAILNGFGIDSFVFMRGAGDEVENTIFKWRYKDENEVIAIHLLTSYGNGANLSNISMDKAVEKIELMKKIYEDRNDANSILLLNGTDHLFPEPEISRRLKKLSEMTENSFELGDLEKYVDEVRRGIEGIKEFRGELRESKYYPILPGVLSTRIYLKQKNREIEDLMVFYAEPLNVFNYIINKKSCRLPWSELLKNHAHDSIYGCGIDEVHVENMKRFECVEKSVMKTISDCIEELSEKNSSFTVYNPVNWCREELVEIVGMPDKVLLNSKGEIVPYVVSNGKLKFIAKVDGISFENYTFAEGKNEEKGSVRSGKRSLENEFLRVYVNEDGSIELYDKVQNKGIKNLNIFADQGDRGDEYNFCGIGDVITSKGSRPNIEVMESNPLFGVLRVEYLMKLPLALSKDRRRREGKVDCNISLFIKVCSGLPRVDITVEVQNCAKDHRLSILFPAGSKNEITAGSKFGVVQRRHENEKKYKRESDLFEKLIETPLPEGKEKGWVEDPPESYPFDRFVDTGEIAIIVKGLFEYSFIEGNLAITLLRCVEHLSRDDLDNRRGDAGPGFETPDAQCQGKHKFEYSLFPGSDLICLYHQALNHNLPLMVFDGKIDGSIMVSPDSLILSSLKVAEDGCGIVLRLYNVEGKRINGKLKLAHNIKRAWLTNLKEDVVKELSVYKDEINFEVESYGIASLKIEL